MSTGLVITGNYCKYFQKSFQLKQLMTRHDSSLKLQKTIKILEAAITANESGEIINKQSVERGIKRSQIIMNH